MSTMPGQEAFEDAGLVEPPLAQPAEAEEIEDYHPAPARPDLTGEAEEADVAEQATDLPEAEGEDYR